MPPVAEGAAWAQAGEMKKSMSVLCGAGLPARLGRAIMAHGASETVRTAVARQGVVTAGSRAAACDRRHSSRTAGSRYVNKWNRNVAGVYSQSTRWRRGLQAPHVPNENDRGDGACAEARLGGLRGVLPILHSRSRPARRSGRQIG